MISTYQVTGMTCEHCVSAVQQEISAIPGVRSVEVDMVAGEASTVIVTAESPITDESIRDAVDEAGYSLV
jgi:copper chaperone CopZ